MNLLTDLVNAHAALARGLDHLRPLLLAGARLWVSWQFLRSGWLKLGSWDVTLELFASEYRVPVLSPAIAAALGTAGELFFPVLLILGLFARVGALGLFAVNLLAVVSYWHVLGAEGYEAALSQHVLWGFMLAVLTATGAGKVSIDAWLDRRLATRPGTGRGSEALGNA